MSTRYPVLLSIILILIMSLALSSTGCDRLVNITGKVYEWVETFYSNEVTDTEGKYKLIISLGYKTDSYDTTVEAVHPGFMPVKRLITDVGDSHVVTIILVRQWAAE